MGTLSVLMVELSAILTWRYCRLDVRLFIVWKDEWTALEGWDKLFFVYNFTKQDLRARINQKQTFETGFELFGLKQAFKVEL